jgi:hypothetical protein
MASLFFEEEFRDNCVFLPDFSGDEWRIDNDHVESVV